MTDQRPTQLFAPGLFEGKVVLVTGAAGGVGAAVAELLFSLGARLALTDLDASALAPWTDRGAVVIPADLRRVDECEKVVAGTLAELGRVDALVSCAGVWVEGDSAAATEADWDRCIDVNLKGTFFVVSRALPALRASRGAVVLLSSDAGVVGNAGAAIYCASKGGVTVLAKSLARELAPDGVRVTALCPSDIRSPMLTFQATRYGGPDPDAYLRNLLGLYPQGPRARFIEPAEVAAYVAFLLSPAAEPVTGAAVAMDFGLTAGY